MVDMFIQIKEGLCQFQTDINVMIYMYKPILKVYFMLNKFA